jgi:hypothetical protein
MSIVIIFTIDDNKQQHSIVVSTEFFSAYIIEKKALS